MKALLLSLLLATSPTTQFDVQPLTAWQALDKYRAWTLLCHELQTDMSCTGIPIPKVKFEAMPPGLYGHYSLGDDTVYINDSIYGTQRIATLVHEMSHYLDTNVNGVERPLTSYLRVCKSEKIAWDITDKYWRAIGHPEKAANGAWVSWYSHCTPYADILYPNGE